MIGSSLNSGKGRKFLHIVWTRWRWWPKGPVSRLFYHPIWIPRPNCDVFFGGHYSLFDDFSSTGSPFRLNLLFRSAARVSAPHRRPDPTLPVTPASPPPPKPISPNSLANSKFLQTQTPAPNPSLPSEASLHILSILCMWSLGLGLASSIPGQTELDGNCQVSGVLIAHTR